MIRREWHKQGERLRCLNVNVRPWVGANVWLGSHREGPLGGGTLDPASSIWCWHAWDDGRGVDERGEAATDVEAMAAVDALLGWEAS